MIRGPTGSPGQLTEPVKQYTASEPTRFVASALRIESLDSHGEAAGSQFVRRTRQTIHQSEHDIELCSI